LGVKAFHFLMSSNLLLDTHLPRQAGPSSRVTFVPSSESDADAHY
jgi:hypothetical protein